MNNIPSEQFLVSLADVQEKISYFDPDGREVSLNLYSISKTLRRLGDVAVVNVSTAPELMAALNKAHLDLNELIVVAKHRLTQTQNAALEARSRIIIDEIPGILAQRKLKDCKENRDALLVLHESWRGWQESISEIETVVQYLRDKAKGVENAWNTVRSILNDKSGRPLAGRTPYTSGGTTGATRISPIDEPIPAPTEPHDTWGTSKF